VLLGLGAGFTSIYVIDVLVRGNRAALWWPLIPGAIFALIGTGIAAARIPELADLLRFWPILLIALGAWLLIARRRGT
jgi:hypothetical protein